MRARVVRPMSKDWNHLKEIVVKLQQVPNFLDGAGWEALAHDDIVGMEIDNVGAVVMDHLVVGAHGRVHVTFWDGRLRGRELLCRRIAEMWLEKYGLAFVYTSIPESSRVVIAFCKRVGFTEVNKQNGYVTLMLQPLDYLHSANSNPGGH